MTSDPDIPASVNESSTDASFLTETKPELALPEQPMSPSDQSPTPQAEGPAPAHDKDVPEAKTASMEEDVTLSLEEVQKYLKRSRASVYRYANTDTENPNPPFDPQKLNPEYRNQKEEALRFHPKEVRRFARDVLGLNPTIEVQPAPETLTHELLRAILKELQSIHETLKSPN